MQRTNESNGCTASPDFDVLGLAVALWRRSQGENVKIEAVDFGAACHWHDWHYTQGGDAAARLLADARLYRNLVALGACPVTAGAYYRRVRLWGGSHFTWRPRPRGRLVALVALVGNLFARYLPVPPAPAPLNK